ncbi:hypothetical protein TRVL_05902 [Trypanosoma vivax]|uniref:LolA-like domain-containing protein n=1 Tax=Trypanosoma vivax (strain Y486) TaxID=1055687 RepID=G0U352_TRYVY|nr:hypothetical protein TRVL_05902 [Trypanosoma vivax]CCC50707.1 conserved hypothetical protein [Trypanosoma vivax Y486]
MLHVCRLLLFLSLVVVPFTAHAVHSFFPVKGDILMSVELVVHRPSAESSTQMHTLMLAGQINSTYPLRVEVLSFGGRKVRLYTGEKHVTLNEMGLCRLNEGNPADDIGLWESVSSILSGVAHASMQHTAKERGLDVVVLSTSLDLAFPVAYGGEKEKTKYSITYYLLDAWTVNYAYAKNSPVKVVLGSPKGTNITFTFFDFEETMLEPEELEIPSSCEESPEDGVIGAATASLPGDEMPEFPDDFSAYVQVIMPSKNSTFTILQQFSAVSNVSWATLYGTVPDVAGRVTTYDWYAIGQYQLSYLRVRKTASGVGVASISESIREFLWGDTDTCKRAQLGVGLVARKASSLLLMPDDARPVYVGRQTVRGIPCKVWASSVSGVRVRWFWVDMDKVEFPAGYGMGSASSILMRIVVEGYGVPPFFVHHPFMAQGVAYPHEHRAAVCDWLNPIDPDCAGHDGPYKYIYDIFSFTSLVSVDGLLLPSSCTSEDTPSVAIPGAFYDVSPVGKSLVYYIVGFLFSAVIGGSVVWLYLSPMLRGLQREIVDIGNEVSKRRVLQAQ